MVMAESSSREVGQGARDAVRKPRFWRDALRRRLLAFSDLLAGVVASVIIAGTPADAFWALALLPAWVVIAKLIGLYDRDHAVIRHLTIDELPLLAAWAGASIALVALILPQTPGGVVESSNAAVAWVAATATTLILRAASRWIWRRTTPPEVTVVLGDGDTAEMIRRKLELFPDMHLALLDASGPHTFEEVTDEVDRVIFASDVIDPGVVGGLVEGCRDRQVKLSVISPLHGRAGPVRLSRVADLPVLEYETWDPSRSTAMIRRSRASEMFSM